MNEIKDSMESAF